jgi:hypothetical protein
MHTVQTHIADMDPHPRDISTADSAMFASPARTVKAVILFTLSMTIGTHSTTVEAQTARSPTMATRNRSARPAFSSPTHTVITSGAKTSRNAVGMANSSATSFTKVRRSERRPSMSPSE